MPQPITHDVPDYPVLNLEVARRGATTHRDCSDDCDAKRYFTQLVPHLERLTRSDSATGWKIWPCERVSESDE